MSDERAIVAAHGGLAAALVEAVGLISGRADRLVPLSNRGLDASAMQVAIADAVSATGARIIFTDLPAGSCTMAARRVQREHPALTVVAGVNLPLLLDFAMATEPTPPVEALVTRAREHLRVWEAPHGH
jgi:PTS system N-acetylgalactosamine-specific IIA component